MATKLFVGEVSHIEWNAESKVILALGDDGSSTQSAKSLNFDTTVHTTSNSPYPDNRSMFLSSLSPREKLTISVRNDSNMKNGLSVREPDEGRFTPQTPSVQSLSVSSSSVTKSPHFQKSSVTNNSINNSAPSSSTMNRQRTGAPMTLSSPSPSPSPQIVKKLCSPPFTPTSTSNHIGGNQSMNSARKGYGAPSSSDSVLDRLRYIEGTLPIQIEMNSLIEGRVYDLDKNVSILEASITPALLELQVRFDRELSVLRREHESRYELTH